ncbi:WhiB family transcriptional regulator [Streptosporangium brasiliense]|uniref:Transcriptional regulator WhiB n=1 Tax=Streptosporangium brasiliense TaxID=47480 RepID=A0ABT9RF46_9ACTN|nr:WhiB family transcriptional regulator [Streptosporangium brasiliense]MDP9867881.1 WhiB family redox-sensing transcriptional regulator [Streptosporangium brasiliense]
MSIQGNVIPIIHWSRRSSCLNEDPELFFPVSAEGPGREQYEQAKAVCRRCPVRLRCLDYALNTRQMYGVWGGTTPDERRAAMAATRRGVR